jgi:hypothetical protein
MAVPPLVYVPPEFDLYEFDDECPSMATRARRWFSHWNGPIGAPAQEVRLGWSAGDATVLVGTQGQLQHEPWARLSAAHLALGGDDLPLARRPPSATATQRELQRIMSSDELWSEAPALIAGGRACQPGSCTSWLHHCLVPSWRGRGVRRGCRHRSWQLQAAEGARLDSVRSRRHPAVSAQRLEKVRSLTAAWRRIAPLVAVWLIGGYWPSRRQQR